MKLRARNIILIIVLVFILFLGISIFLGYQSLKDSLPPRSGSIEMAGIQDSVEITFDEMGIPQVWASNEEDAYFAMGWLHASDRLFQMEMTRKVSQGRLAELFGRAVLSIDLHQRTIGHGRIAEKYLAELDDNSRKKLEAYTRGVNSYVQNAESLPFEFLLMRKGFEDWSIKDCLTMLSFQTWFSDFLMSPDEFMGMTSDKLGAEKTRSLDIPYPVWAPRVVPADEQLSINDFSPAGLMAKEFFANLDLPFRMSNSSNSWVTAPHKSESGSAMLASDPHLEIRSLPQFWYYLGLHAKNGGLNVLGISTPGIPLVVMGHNGRAAWAFTVSGIDVNEYYQEKINPEDSTQYLTPSGWEKFEVLKEDVIISGEKEPFPLNIRITRHGPVVFEFDTLKNVYSLHWAGFDADLAGAVKAGFDLMKTADFEGFRSAVTNLGALDAAWTYADALGNIGFQLGTPIAVRPNNPNNQPVPGWTDEYEWQGFVPLDKTPHSFNPPRGWLATCNNKQDDANLDYPLYGKFASDRIMRINELLSSQDKFSVTDMQKFQMDVTDAYLTRWNDIVSAELKKAGKAQLAAEIEAWDGYAGADSKEAALVILFINQLRHLVFDDELGGMSKKLFYADVEQIFREGPLDWFDNTETEDVKESKDEIAAKALQEALQMLGSYVWGDFHTLTMTHPLAVVPVAGSLLKLKHGPYPWHGTIGTLNASFYGEKVTEPGNFSSIVGPSWRFVIDFADPDAVTMVLPAGVSGNPMSEHFMDFFEMWRDGGRWNVPFTYEKVKSKTFSTLNFSPFN